MPANLYERSCTADEEVAINDLVVSLSGALAG